MSSFKKFDVYAEIEKLEPAHAIPANSANSVSSRTEISRLAKLAEPLLQESVTTVAHPSGLKICGVRDVTDDMPRSELLKTYIKIRDYVESKLLSSDYYKKTDRTANDAKLLESHSGLGYMADCLTLQYLDVIIKKLKNELRL